MPRGEQRARSGRAERGAACLLDRDHQLAAIQATLEQAEGGSGEALLIEGHAGLGKTRLHEAALDGARGMGFRILRAAGTELEHHMAFGIAAQLLAAQLDEFSAKRRETTLAGLPHRVRTLLGNSPHDQGPVEGSDLGLVHSVFTVIATQEETRPALLAIDDLHWCDTASLEFVLYLLHRLDELPMAVVMTRRTGMGEAVSDMLDRIATHPRVRVETLVPLGPTALSKLAWRVLGERADRALVDACLEATAGNPFFLHELLIALRDEGELSESELAQRAASLVPEAVVRALRVRVGRLGQSAAALARAVVVLGDDVPLRQAATLAGLDMASASAATDALAGVEVLQAGEPLSFLHTLVRQALERDIPPGELATRHFEAARLLHSEDAPLEKVVAHLMLSHRRGDAWVVEQLCAAAREARARASPRSAVSYLRRALEEPPSGDLRTTVLGELGATEAAAGLVEAASHFAQAMAASRDPRRRAELALQQGRSLSNQGLHEEAAKTYEMGLAELPQEPTDLEELELRDQLEADFVATAGLVPALQKRVLTRSAQLLARATDGATTQGQRLRLAQAALHAASQGEPAETVTEHAKRAWDGGRLLEHGTPQGMGWRFVSAAFFLAGEFERAIGVADAALAEARRLGWPFALASAALMRAFPLLGRGEVDDAISEYETAREARSLGWRQYDGWIAAQLSLALIEKGEHERAEQVLFENAPVEQTADLQDAMGKYSLAVLRLAQGRCHEALEAAVSSGAVLERDVEYFGYTPWRTTAAEAALAVGDRRRALALAEDAAQRAQRGRVLHELIRTKRVLGMCQGPREGLAMLQASAELAKNAPPRLETVKTLVELGAALRRANKRVAARDPLQRAADLAWAGGATALHDRARTELAASGARPRRVMLLSGPESLTPSERRIAELAAVGHSNREIAQALFVTPKTVEYHLRNTYRKLDIEGRENLSGVLVA
ncbi:MAG: AAA family ATPase [Solirubrobacterales bacterium]|nr:AAA family ATPase [Solirubrobacterales bacterium]